MTPLRLLFDSNAFFAAIEASKHGIHPDAEQATQLMELANRHDCEVWLTQATSQDINRATNPKQRKATNLRMKQWRTLNPLSVSNELLDRAGYTRHLSDNDQVDTHMLAALEVNAVDVLVTQDKTLRRHADTAGYGDRAMSIRGAIDLLERLFDTPTHFPTVVRQKAYQLATEDPIFDSIREEYDDFDDWLAKAAGEHRDCLVIQGPGPGGIEALAILKTEGHGPHGLAGKVLKISTLKVARHAAGAKRGELLLKAALDYAATNHHDRIYVEVYETHDGVIRLLERFGFADSGARTHRGELVMVKHLASTDADTDLSPLEYHTKFGPPAVLVRDAFIIPIQPRWHDALFPEARPHPELFAPNTYGNAILKAYLTHSKITKITPGAVALFYRSDDAKAVTAVGVVDGLLRSSDPAKIRRFVGQRTVYSDSDLQAMCANGVEVLAVLFRHDRVLTDPWSRAELIELGAIKAAPQTVQQVHDEGALEWLRTQLAAQR